MLNNEEIRRDNPDYETILQDAREFEEALWDFDLEETKIFEDEKLEKAKNIIREVYLTSGPYAAEEEYASALRRGYVLPPMEIMFKSFDEEFVNA